MALGISRSLIKIDENLKPTLKARLLTRDPRMKERKNMVSGQHGLVFNSLNGNIFNYRSPEVGGSFCFRCFLVFQNSLCKNKNFGGGCCIHFLKLIYLS